MSLVSHTPRDIHVPILTADQIMAGANPTTRPISVVPAGLAQSVERKTLNLKAAGSTPAFGYSYKPNLRFLFFFVDENSA
ncbi:hypothetical protein N7536_008963 [Penicillium majusculum]|nr:hypothetical protein N7536_008963 [Penicillium majusculum]